MIKYIIILSMVFAICCSQPKVAENKDPKTKQDSVISVKSTPFNNPAIIYGSSFGNYFQSLFKLAKYDEMIKFTSKQTIDKYGKDKLQKMYSQLDFAFPLKLKNINEEKSNGISQLTYETSIVATKKVFRMDVIIENDSVKLVSSDLKGFPTN